MVDGLWKLLTITALGVPPPLPWKTRRRLSKSAFNRVLELSVPGHVGMTVGWKTRGTVCSPQSSVSPFPEFLRILTFYLQIKTSLTLKKYLVA